MQNTELRVRVRPRGSVGGRRRDDLHARTGVRYEAGRCAGQLLCVLFFLSRILISPFHRKRALALSSRPLRGQAKLSFCRDFYFRIHLRDTSVRNARESRMRASHVRQTSGRSIEEHLETGSPGER